MSKNIEKIYKKSIEQIVPNVLDDIFAQNVLPMEKEDDIICQGDKKKEKHKRNQIYLSAISMVAAAIFLLFLYDKTVVVTRIIIDVNPSFEVQLNKEGHVKKVIGINNDAQNILSQITFPDNNLKNTIEKLIRAINKNGYFKDKTAVLVSVQNNQINAAANMEKTIKKQIKNLCKNSDTNPHIYTQSIENNKEIQEVAQNYHISNGRATLICKILKKDSSWNIENLASMTIEELLDSVEQKGMKVSDILEKSKKKTVSNKTKNNKTKEKKNKVTPSPDVKTKKKNAQEIDTTKIDATVKPDKKEEKTDNSKNNTTKSKDNNKNKKDKDKKREKNPSSQDSDKTNYKDQEKKREKKKPDEENLSEAPFDDAEKRPPKDKEDLNEEHPTRDKRDGRDNKNGDHKKN